MSFTADLRPEIAVAWHRAELNGLHPGMDVRETPVLEVDRHSRLLLAAGPVLDRLAVDLAETRFSVLLADHCARIVDRRVGDRQLHDALDDVKAIPGTQYLEEVSGTNALSTAFELRKPIVVAGGEHFLEALRVFCCYGAPILHPITRRLEGVLDITGPAADASGLLRPLVLRAVRDIEARLQEGSRQVEQRLFAEFQARTARTRGAVVALCEDLCLSNGTAMDLVADADQAMLRTIAASVTRRPLTVDQTLASGRPVRIRAERVVDGRDGVLLELQLAEARTGRGVPHDTTAPKVTLIEGEPGTGRTTTAVALVGTPHELVDCREPDGPALLDRSGVLLAGTTPVVLDNIEALSGPDAVKVRARVLRARALVVMTSSPAPGPTPAHDALRSVALARTKLHALRYRTLELPALVRAMLAELRPESPLRVTPSALTTLSRHAWPGNLTELGAVGLRRRRGRVPRCGDVGGPCMARRLILDTGVLIASERASSAWADALDADDDAALAAVGIAELRTGVELASASRRAAGRPSSNASSRRSPSRSTTWRSPRCTAGCWQRCIARGSSAGPTT